MNEVNEIIEKKVVVRQDPPAEYILIVRCIYYVVDVIEIVLGLRFIARALGANGGNPFIRFLYSVSGALLAPFRGIFPAVGQSGFVFEWSTLFAMVIYVLLAMLIVRLLRILFVR